MAKLTKKQIAVIRSIFNDMTKAETMLYSSNTVIATKTTITSAKEHTYINQATGEQVVEFNKNVGSDLCYFANALGKLNHFLNNNQ